MRGESLQMINIEPDVKEMAQLWIHVSKFIENQNISCNDAIGQCDNIILNAYDFIGGCCEIVGYTGSDDEDGWEDEK